jgi:hypothetical protein
MKSLQVIVTTLCAAIRLQAGDLFIEMKADQQSVAKISLRIEEDIATTWVAGLTERFNLRDMSWFHEGTGQWITQAQCKAWAEQSKAKTVESADSAPVQIRSFLLWSLDPTFTVTKTNNTLRLTSGQVDYVIDGHASDSDVDRYFRYAVLNAYKKAMTDRKLPPYAELKAIDEMKALGHIPRRIAVTIPGVQGAPAVDIEITEKDRKGQPDGPANRSLPVVH